MAIERPPRNPSLNLETVKSYRPPEDQVYAWHTVTSGMLENFNTIAARHRVPVEKVIGFNFPGTVENGRVMTEVVNWYLRHHKGFGGPETRDRLNRMFKGGEKVAIPFTGRVDLGEPILIGLAKPAKLDEPGGHIIASQKFVHEFKVPSKPAEIGYLAVQARFSIEGEIIQDGLVKTQFKKDSIKAAIEKQIDGELKASFSGKFDEKVLKAVAENVAKGSKDGVVRALAAPFEASLKQNYKFGKITVVPEVGVEGIELIKTPGQLPTPFAFRVAGDYADTFPVDGLPLKWKLAFKAGFNVGLSKQGWTWVAQRVGGEALKRFLANAGRSLAMVAEYLVAEGILAAAGVAVAVIGSGIAVTALVAWLAAESGRKGTLRGLAAWYYQAYLNKIFRRPRPSGFVPYENARMRDELIQLGEKDAITTARNIVQKRGEQHIYQSDDAVLERYREIAIHLYGSEANAEQQLTRALRDYIERQLGL